MVNLNKRAFEAMPDLANAGPIRLFLVRACSPDPSYLSMPFAPLFPSLGSEEIVVFASHCGHRSGRYRVIITIWKASYTVGCSLTWWITSQTTPGSLQSPRGSHLGGILGVDEWPLYRSSRWKSAFPRDLGITSMRVYRVDMTKLGLIPSRRPMLWARMMRFVRDVVKGKMISRGRGWRTS